MLMDNPYFPPFSKKEYGRRRSMIQNAMAEKGLDCLVIFGAYRFSGTDTGQINAQYLSNYAGVYHTYVVLPLRGEPTLMVAYGLHVPNARDISPIQDVRPAQGGYHRAVGERLKELGVGKGNIGIVGPIATWTREFLLPFEHYEYLKQTFPQANFEEVTFWYEQLRMVKSEEELRVLERAAGLTDLAYEELILATRPGARHADLRRVVEHFALRQNAIYPICHVSSTPMADPNMVYPDYWPTYRTVEDGHVVMTELPIGIGNLSCKIMGTYFVGEPTREYRRLYEAAAAAYEQAVQGLKPGMTGREAKQYVKPIEDAGYTTIGPLVMGWGLGSEPPTVGAVDGSPGAIAERQENLDFVFKPGHTAYIVGRAATPDLKRGVWVGSSCVFTDQGLRKLNKSPVGEIRVV